MTTTQRVGSRGPLRSTTQADIVDAAMALLDEEGFDALSLRSVAARMGLRAPSLYTYVRSKDELVQLVLGRLAADTVLPEDAALPPVEQLRAFAWRWRERCMRHPQLATVGGIGPQPGQDTWEFIEHFLGLLVGLGLQPSQAFALLRAVFKLAMGNGVYAATQLRDNVMEARLLSEADLSTTPLLASLRDHGTPSSFEQGFAEELDLLLDAALDHLLEH